jgi:hypothetical protein
MIESLVAVIYTAAIIYKLGLKNNERLMIKDLILKKIKK